MIPLRDLNHLCAERTVARSIPAQIVCRLLGNAIKPCPCDPLCKPANTHGVWFFYSVLTAMSFAALMLTFWLLHITRIGWVLSLVGRLLLPPLRWAIGAGAALYRFFVYLAEQFED